MTESYGWYCRECGLRYRESTCTKDGNLIFCPSGHNLNEVGFWIYRKTTKTYMRIVIGAVDQHNDWRCLTTLLDKTILYDLFKQEIEQLKKANPKIADVIDNAVNQFASFSGRDWRSKCSLCANYERCKKWKTIYCKEFIRKDRINRVFH